MDENKKHDKPNPKESANWCNKLVFWWMNPLFRYGMKNDLKIKDLYNVLPSDVSAMLGDSLEDNWYTEMETAHKAGRPPKLLNALKKTFFKSFAIYGGWIFILCVVLRVVQPYVLGLLIWHFDPRALSTTAEAYMYATGVIVSAILIAFITHHTILGQMEVGMRMRIACSSLIYRKILRLSKKSIGSTTTGQMINLLSNDVARFDLLFMHLHYIWIMPIQGALISYLIWRSVGIASLAGIILITIQTIPAQGYISKITSRLRLKIAIKTDERIRLMSEIIKGIKVIKMYTWEKPFEHLVSLARRREIDVLTLTSYLRGFTLATFVFTERTTLFFTIMTYVLMGNSISADKVFSMAQYYNILQLTMAILYPMAVSAAAEAAVSIKRLENFLLLDENVVSAHPNTNITDKTGGDNATVINVKNVTASWIEKPISHTLHEISISIQQGKLYALVGPVGTGKSSFLQLILEELQPLRGQVRVNGSISYASQESWLFSGTIRDNILFGMPYNKNTYREVIRICALLKDFEQLPSGDNTILGDSGTVLSGGQRARINLARAVYRSADIYLLDDPLSAVDTHVGKQLFEDCIRDYLKNKTRILVTHQTQYLKDCDFIVIFNHGRIEMIGTYAEVSKRQIDFLKSLNTNTTKNESVVVENDVDTTLNSPQLEDEEDDTDLEKKEQVELMVKEKALKSVYWKYFRAGGSILTIFCFFLSLILGQIGSSGCDYWVAYWTNQEELRFKENSNISNNVNVSYNMDNLNVDYIEPKYLDNDLALWIYGGFIIGSVVMTTTRNILFYKICMNASKNLHNLMFSNLLKAPMRFFNTHPSGRILNRFSKDIGAVDEVLPRTMIESIQIFAVLTGILFQVLINNWWSIFAILIMGVLYWQIGNIYLSSAQNLKRLEGTTKSPVFSHVNSTLSGLITIRSLGMQRLVSHEFDKFQDVHTSAYSLILSAGVTFGFALDAVSITFVAFITYSFIFLNDGNTFAGNVGLVVSQVLILCGMLQYGMRQTAEAIAQMTSVERILQYTKLDKEGPFESLPNTLPTQWPSKGEMKFDSVSLYYSEIGLPVLKSLNFSIEGHSKIGIVGRTGAGKSSLISALFNLSKVEGSIYIDGINIMDVGLHDLRSKISIIPQEPMLFSATLRDNLDPFHNFDDAAIWTALEEVDLKHTVPSLDHPVEQGGSNFSIGQRQLLCLARAIIKNNKILLLDEATANVDPTTDSLIQTTIRKKFRDCTVLTIAHRLNTIMDSDKVLVLELGEMKEFDHPFTLLQNKNSYFYKMVSNMGAVTLTQFKEIAKEAFEKTHTSINAN